MPDLFRYLILASFAAALVSVVGMLVRDTRARAQRDHEARIARRLSGAF